MNCILCTDVVIEHPTREDTGCVTVAESPISLDECYEKKSGEAQCQRAYYSSVIRVVAARASLQGGEFISESKD